METLNNAKQLTQLTDKNILLDFTATWCGPCKKLTPVLEDLSIEISDIKFLKVDIEDLSDLAEEYNIDAVPTLVILKDGKEVARLEGGLGKTALKNWIEKGIK